MKTAAWLGAAARIGWLALRTHRRPWRAVRALEHLQENEPRRWSTPTRSPRRFAPRQCVAAAGRYFFEFNLPGWPSAAFDRCIERELGRVLPPQPRQALHTAILAMTRRCQLKCEHCFEWDALGPAETLSRDDLIEIVRRLQRHGVAQLLLSNWVWLISE